MVAQKKLFISLFLAIFPSATVAGQFSDESNFAQRGMIVLIDDSEKNLGAISDKFLMAVGQQAGPIIVSASIGANVFSEYNAPSKEEDPAALVEKFKEGKEQKRIALQALSFDPNAWTIKKSMMISISSYRITT
jgi:hypothetical protein